MTTFDTTSDLGIDDGLGPREYTPMEVPDYRPPKPLRAAAVDHAIRKQRAATPPDVADARSVKRMSIEEMNAADPADLKARFYSAPYDDRSGFTRFLDLVDLPRNVIGNLLAGAVAPGLRDKQVEAGETGTFGMARVRFSDILDHLGVKNHVINGVVGFVGDVALDPLTYLGGAGLGSKLVGTGGRSVELLAEGRRAINAASKLAARGGAVSGELGAYLKAVGVAETVAKAQAEGKDVAAAIRAAHLYGGESGMAKKAATGAFGLDFKNTNSPLANLALTVLTEAEAKANPALAAQVKAAKAVVARYGRAAAPGVGIVRNAAGRLAMATYGPGESAAKGGSYIAHIPFTSYGLFVPGFTDPAARSMVTRAIATSGWARGLDAETQAFKDVADRAGAFRQQAEAYMNQAGNLADPASELAHVEGLRKVAEGVEGVKADLQKLADTRKPVAAESVADVLYREQQQDIALGNAKALQSQLDDTKEVLADRKALLDQIGYKPGETIDPAVASEPYHKALLGMSDAELASREALADSLHREIQSRAELAHALQGSITETGISGNTILARVALQSMGLDSETHGHSVFTGMGNTMRRVFGSKNSAAQYATGMIDALDELGRKNLGMGASGSATRVRKAFQRGGPAAVQQAKEHWHNTIRAPIVKAARDTGREGQALAKFVTEAEKVATSLAYAVDHTLDPREALMIAKFREAGGNDIFPMLQELAAQSKDALRGIGERDLAVGSLSRMRPKYLPGGLTPEGVEARKLRDIAEAKDGPKIAGMVPDADFDSPQQMMRAAFVAKIGDTEIPAVLYRHEHKFYKRFTDAKIASLLADPATKDIGQYVEKMRAIARAWDELPASERIGASAFVEASPFIKNLEAPQHMGMMNVGIPERGYFEESLPEMMMARAGQSEEAYSNKLYQAMHEGVLKLFPKFKLDAENMKPKGEARTITFVDGSKGTVSELDAAKGRFVVTLANGERYIQLSDPAKAFHTLNAWGAGMNDVNEMIGVYPERLAAIKNKTVETLADPDGMLRVLDKTLGIWKSLTLTNPSWMINDAAGNAIQLSNMGLAPDKILGAVKRAFQIVFADTPEKIKRLGKITIAGKEATADAWRDASSTIRKGHAHGITAEEAFVNGNLQMAPHRLFSDAGGIKAHLSDMNERAAQAVRNAKEAKRLANIPFAEQLLKTKNLVWDEGFVRHLIAPWFAMNGKINDVMRLTGWIASHESGMDAGAATAHVLEHMFDFEDLSNFEKSWMRRLIPFYSWLKSSSAYGLSQMLENPKYLAIAPRVKSAIEQTLYGDQTVPDHLRPNWMRDQLAMQLGSDPTNRFALSVATILPQEGAYKIGEAVASPALGMEALKDFMQYVGFGFNPLLRTITDLAQGQEGFSGRSISFSPDQGDLTAGEYLLNQIGPLRNLGVGNIRGSPIGAAFEKSVAGGVGKVLEGGRIQPFDAERLEQNTLREFKQVEDQIRKRIRVAVRSKNKSAERAGRARLMSLYSKMRKKGAGKAVPRWANAQLDTILTR